MFACGIGLVLCLVLARCLPESATACHAVGTYAGSASRPLTDSGCPWNVLLEIEISVASPSDDDLVSDRRAYHVAGVGDGCRGTVPDGTCVMHVQCTDALLELIVTDAGLSGTLQYEDSGCEATVTVTAERQ